MKLARALVAMILAALGSGAAFAQATGGLNIRVIDNADKSPIVGAAVTLSNAQGFLKPTTILTNAKGEALFPVLRPGQLYTVDVVTDGYARIKQDFKVGTSIQDVIISMAPEHVEKIIVTGEKTHVDLDQNAETTKFSSEFIQDLPVPGRFYQNVLALAPGVQDPDGDGNPNVNGARDRDFKTSVSGISNVDPLTGKFLSLVAADSIEEISVVTSGAGVEYGRAQGGYADIIQKQGSNDFEGVVGTIYSSHLLDGTGATGLSRNQLPDFYHYQPSLQVSGPVVKDKLWYRLTQEYIREEDPVVLGAGGSVGVVGINQFSTADQLTWQVSNRNKLAFQYQADPRTDTNVGLSTLSPLSTTRRREFGGPTYSAKWTAPYSPSLLIDSVVAYQDAHQDFLPTTTGQRSGCSANEVIDQTQCFDAATGLVSGSFPLTWKDNRQRLTVKTDATYYKGRMWGMSHQFKFGMIIENERYFKSLLRRPTAVDLGGGGGGGSQVGDELFQVSFSLQPSSQQRAVGTTWGIYGEDIFRPKSSLSITLGIRVSQENISSNGFKPFDPAAEAEAFKEASVGLGGQQVAELLQHYFVAYENLQNAKNAINVQIPGLTLGDTGSTQQQAFWSLSRQPDNIDLHNTNVEPRFSLAWDPWNNGKSKFTVAAGRYYDKIFLAVPEAEVEPVIGTFLWTSSQIAGTAPYNPTLSFSVVDRNLKTPFQDEYSASFERDILQESSISVRYVHRNFRQQLQDIDINNAPGDFGRCSVMARPSDPWLVPSPGTGPVVDPYTGVTYQDTDPGIGDGRRDDCSGKRVRVGGSSGDGGPNNAANFIQLPDGVADLYVLNPAWGSIFKIGNFNSAKYDGVILEFVRRQYKNWQMEASYTWSRAVGDGEDFNIGLGDDRSTLQDEYGYQSYDRRHALKVNATAITPWGFRLGGAISWQSGLPYSLLTRTFSESTAPPLYIGITEPFIAQRITYNTHRRNDQRNRSYWNVDAKFVKEMNLPKGMNLQLTAEVFNLLNDNTYTVYDFNGNIGFQLNGTNDAYRRFGRQYQVGVRLAF